MCNAHNHSAYCGCGFGGDTGGAPPVRPVQSATRNTNWSIATLESRLTHPTKCWWCGEKVFFHRDEHGGCALFDELGYPWPLHACWEEHRNHQKAALQRYEQELRTLGFDGSRYVARGTLQVAPSGTTGPLRIHGFVTRRRAATLTFRAGGVASAMEFVKVEVATSDNRLYHVVIPATGAWMLKRYGSVRAECDWIARGTKWVLLAKRFLHGTTHQRDREIPGLQLDLPPTCVWCSEPLGIRMKWGISPDGALECASCGTRRGRHSPESFRRHLQVDQRLQENREVAVPEELIGTYRAQPAIRGRPVLEFSLGADRTWRLPGRPDPAGGYTYERRVLRLYDATQLLYTFSVAVEPREIRLTEIEKAASPFRRAAPGSVQCVRPLPARPSG